MTTQTACSPEVTFVDLLRLSLGLGISEDHAEIRSKFRTTLDHR